MDGLFAMSLGVHRALPRAVTLGHVRYHAYYKETGRSCQVYTLEKGPGDRRSDSASGVSGSLAPCNTADEGMTCNRWYKSQHLAG